MKIPQHTKILIIGAGPGGAMAALQLSKLGIKSTIVDKAVFPRDKICGDALSAKVVNLMGRIDAQMPIDFAKMAQQNLPSWGIKFVAPNGKKLEIPFKKDYNASADEPLGYVSKRMDFDNFLVKQLKKDANIQLIENLALTKFEKLDHGYRFFDKQQTVSISTDLVLIANGANSQFSKKIGQIERERNHYSAGIRAYYKNVAQNHVDGFIELHFFKSLLPGYFWIFPLPNGHANVGVGMLSSEISKKKVNLKKEMLQLIATEESLKERFENAELIGKIDGWGLPLGSKKRSVSGDHYMLVGDAGYFVDPFTGEGIGNAMYCGMYAANQAIKCLDKNDFSAKMMQQYDVDIYRVLGQELQLSRKLQLLLNYPFIFNGFAKLATRNKKIGELMSSMFFDMDLREKLLSPKFLFNLLLNR
jgi:geranylgeranyl reductase family protein